MPFVKTGVSFVFVFLLSSNLVAAEEPDAPALRIERQVSIDSGYFPKYYTNQSIAKFNMQFLMLHTLAIDAVTNLSIFNKASDKTLLSIRPWLNVGLEVGLSFFFAGPMRLSYHEFGHAMRGQAIGFDYKFVPSINGKPDMSRSSDNYYGYLFMNLVTPEVDGGWTYYTSGTYYFPEKKDKLEAIISMAGVNNSTFMAETIADNIYLHNGHSYYFWYYVYSKWDLPRYALEDKDNAGGTGDLQRVVDYYKQKGVQISLNDIAIISAISIGISATTISYFYSFFSKDVPWGVVKPLEFGPVRYPEFSMYLTSHGPSGKMDSGIRISDKTVLPFGFEVVFLGDTRVEFSPGLIQKFDRLTLEANVVIGEGLGGRLGAAYKLFETKPLDIWIQGYVNYFDANTLIGERQTSDIRNKLPGSLEANISLMATY